MLINDLTFCLPKFKTLQTRAFETCIRLSRVAICGARHTRHVDEGCNAALFLLEVGPLTLSASSLVCLINHRGRHYWGGVVPAPRAMSNLEFSWATAPEIVRAYQKDVFINSSLRGQLRDLLQWLRGVRFVNARGAELEMLASALYLGLTTLVGSRTPGEEYTDLFYVTSKQALPGWARRLALVLMITGGPYALRHTTKFILARIGNKLDECRKPFNGFDPATLASVHLAIFYFSGAYYQLAKRLCGLRYILTHYVDPGESRHSYEFLGVLLLARSLGKFAQTTWQRSQDLDNLGCDKGEITLDDSSIFPFIPGDARQCTLCFESMRAPSVTLCGHIFCWQCATEWCRDNRECPLCRQGCEEQDLLLLHP